MRIREMHGAAIIAAAMGATLSLTAPRPAHAQAAAAKQVVGYLYTTTNGEGINVVVRLARYEDGTVGDGKTYSTYVRGGANHNAPALGDYDAQGQTRIVGDFLLTADVGAPSVSVFKIDRPSGELTLTLPGHFRIKRRLEPAPAMRAADGRGEMGEQPPHDGAAQSG